jgi:hypothetical protein
MFRYLKRYVNDSAEKLKELHNEAAEAVVQDGTSKLYLKF